MIHGIAGLVLVLAAAGEGTGSRWTATADALTRSGYSHVGISDEGGWVLTPTECFQWVVRPGGLAIVGYPDGTAVYLAGCRADHWIWR